MLKALSITELNEVRTRVLAIRNARVEAQRGGEQYVARAASVCVSVDARVAERVARWRVDRMRKGII